ncbi:helix-turn-helix domain-containing protein [Bacteriovorax stolpii]|nr:helix-turn-helix domain-containing protein [Bacteriovorax stolpii]
MNETTSEHSHSSFSVNQELRRMTAAYLDKHPGLTLNALAQRSGVPATTMRRLMQEEQRSELAPHTVLALTSYLLKERKISKILKLVEGPIADLLNKCFDQFIFDEKSSTHEMSADLNTVFQDKFCYLIYKMAANKNGTSIDDVKNAFGLVGLRKLIDLIDKNWILKNDKDERLHAREKNFSVDLALAHELSHALVDLYKPCDVKSGLNLFYSLSEGMSEEGIKKIKEIEKDAVKKIYDVMNTESLQGDLPYFALIVSDVMGPTPLNEANTGVLQ